MRRFRFACLAIASACSGAVAVDAARPQYGGTLRVETRAPLQTLDPLDEPTDRFAAAVRRRILSSIFETLVEPDPAGGIRPLLAMSWEADASRRRWTFRLQPGVRLHDGSPLQGWQIAAVLRSNREWTVSADGDLVVVQAPRPEPDLPWDLAGGRYAIAVRGAATELLGTGPFRIERLDAGRVSLRAHDSCWSGRPFVDRIEVQTARSAGAQLADLELDRADLVEIQPADAARMVQRGLQVAASRPRDLFAVVFEPHRATPANERMRRLLAGTLDRAAISTVLLQGRAEAAAALLPSWLSGYAPVFVVPAISRPSRSAVAGLPQDQRTLALRIDPNDATSQAIVERIAVDAREAGFVVTVQAPGGLAPRPDARLVRVVVDATTPDRALVRVAAGLRSATTDSPSIVGGPLDASIRVENALLQDAIVLPVVHLADVYGLAASVDVSSGEAVTAMGGWNLANLWIRATAKGRAR